MKAYLKPTAKLYMVGSSASTSRSSKNKNEKQDYPPCTVTGVAPGRQPELQNRYESRRVATYKAPLGLLISNIYIIVMYDTVPYIQDLSSSSLSIKMSWISSNVKL